MKLGTGWCIVVCDRNFFSQIEAIKWFHLNLICFCLILVTVAAAAAICLIHSVWAKRDINTHTWIMANTMATVSALPEMGVKQRLKDPFKTCRLCFQTPGTHDVSVAPFYLQAIKQLYNIVVSSTPNAFFFDECFSTCIFCWYFELIEMLMLLPLLDWTKGQIHKIGMRKMYWIDTRIFNASGIGKSWTACLFEAYRNVRTGMFNMSFVICVSVKLF